MIDKEKILRYYKSTGEDIVAAKLLSLAEIAEKTGKYKVSEFLSPGEFAIAEVIASSAELNVVAEGGFANAERNKAVFVHKDFSYGIVSGIVALEVTWNKEYYKIAHKDLMGAILAICKRECIGDINITDNGAQFVAEEKMAAFLLDNLTQVGAAAVSIKAIDISDLEARQEKVKVINATVATLRLDSVAAAGYGVSRTMMTEGIKMQQVKLNHKPAKGASVEVKVGDIISYRGRGRVEVFDIRGTTKKGRTAITLHRFI